jgi:hypothetical protein
MEQRFLFSGTAKSGVSMHRYTTRERERERERERAHGFTRSPGSCPTQAFPSAAACYYILADVRLAGSLYPLVHNHYYANEKGDENIYYKIHVTSPVEYIWWGYGVQLERAVRQDDD